MDIDSDSQTNGSEIRIKIFLIWSALIERIKKHQKKSLQAVFHTVDHYNFSN